MIALFALSAISFMVAAIVFFFSDNEPEYRVGQRKFVRYCMAVGTTLALLIPVVSLFS